jgi:hypothetical protein
MMYMPVLVNVATGTQQCPPCPQDEGPQIEFTSREELEAKAADLEREAAELKRRAKQAMLEAASMTSASPTSHAPEPVVWAMPQAVTCQTAPCEAPAVACHAVPYHAVCQAVPCQPMACQAASFQAMPILCQTDSQQAVQQLGTMVACFVAPSQDLGVHGVSPPGVWESHASNAAGYDKSIQSPEVAQVSGGKESRTTLMLRNLPNDYTRDMTIDILNRKGFAGQFDFFYTPVDFHSNAGLGYAFVNAVSHEAALAMWRSLQDFNDWAIPSHKVLDISWSELSQGLEAHIERYRNSPVMHPDVPQEFKPVLFHQGVLREFPAPTKQIHAPRLKALRQGQRKSFDPQNTESSAQVCEKSHGLTPWDRIKKTIAMINSGDLGRICAHARDTLASTVVLCVPQLGEFKNIAQVCNFHQRLLEAIPDIKLSLENIEAKMGTEKKIIWRVTCNGTQVKPLLPWLSVGAQKTFTLQVTVVQNHSGKPKWLEWSFCRTDSEASPVGQDQVAEEVDEEIDEKRLKHLRGECQPCAYFAFRSDGCRRGDDCEFCHLCTKTQARAKKKAKALRIAREAKAAEDTSANETSEDGDSN